MWSEVNSRVNYPIKTLLVEMVENGQLKMDDPLHLFCASWLSVRVSFVGIGSPGTVCCSSACLVYSLSCVA